MASKHFLYTLVFDAEPEPVVFYVGHTNDPKRRSTEHRSCAKDPANTEYKYRWCRELAALGIGWNFVVIGEIEDDEDSEYEWVLRFARKNKELGITFFDDLPLTNMKAGDFLTEIINDRTISSRDEIKAYRIKREQQLTVDYNRVKPTAKAQAIIDKTLEQAQQSQLENAKKELEKLNKEAKHTAMLNDPERIERIRKQTADLMKMELLEKSIKWREQHSDIMANGGYPDWTAQPDQFARKK